MARSPVPGLSSARRAAGCWIAAFVLLLSAPGPAAADNILGLSADDPPVPISTEFSITLSMDFDEPLIGAGVDVLFDPSLVELVSVSFDATLGDDPTLRLLCPSSDPACALFSVPHSVTLGWGSFSGLAGTHVVATAVFRGIAAGDAHFLIQESDGLGGVVPFDPPFASAPALENTTVTIVPEPGVGVLLLWGLVCLGRAGARSPPTSRPMR
jgi:hypothetical protein